MTTTTHIYCQAEIDAATQAIKSHEQLRQLTELLQWANASDADESDRPACYASQRGFYGHISAAINEILEAEAQVNYHQIRDPNYGGDGSWYESLLVAVGAVLIERKRDEQAVAHRQSVERRIVRRIIKDAVAAGYTLGVYNGEELVINRSSNLRAIMDEMFSVDDEQLIVYGADGKRLGWVRLVYGNCGWDVICDHSTNLEDLLAEAFRLAERLSYDC